MANIYEQEIKKYKDKKGPQIRNELFKYLWDTHHVPHFDRDVLYLIALLLAFADGRGLSEETELANIIRYVIESNEPRINDGCSHESLDKLVNGNVSRVLNELSTFGYSFNHYNFESNKKYYKELVDYMIMILASRQYIKEEELAFLEQLVSPIEKVSLQGKGLSCDLREEDDEQYVPEVSTKYKFINYNLSAKERFNIFLKHQPRKDPRRFKDEIEAICSKLGYSYYLLEFIQKASIYLVTMDGTVINGRTAMLARGASYGIYNKFYSDFPDEKQLPDYVKNLYPKIREDIIDVFKNFYRFALRYSTPKYISMFASKENEDLSFRALLDTYIFFKVSLNGSGTDKQKAAFIEKIFAFMEEDKTKVSPKKDVKKEDKAESKKVDKVEAKKEHPKEDNKAKPKKTSSVSNSGVNLYARNININFIVEYDDSYDSGYEDARNMDLYNSGDFYDYLYGTLERQPLINASDFNENIVTLEGKETVLTDILEQFEDVDNVYSGVITKASTIILKYLKCDYDGKEDIYYVTGIKDIHSIGYLALGFGKERFVITSNAFNKRNIVNLYLGPNVLKVETNAFPSLTTCVISICEGVNCIESQAFVINNNGTIRYGGDTIPESWSKDWNLKKRTGNFTTLGVEELKLSKEDIPDKVNNYNKYSNVTWVSSGPVNQDDLLKSVLKDKKKLLKFLSTNPSYVNKLSEEYRNDVEIFDVVLYNNISYFSYAGDDLKNNKEYILKRLESHRGKDILPYISPELLNDSSFMVKLLDVNEDSIECIGEALKNNKAYWLKAVTIDATKVEYAGEAILKDKDVALGAVNNNGVAIQYFDKSIRSDKKIALEAIEKNGSALGYLDESLSDLKNDKKVVMAAIKSNPYSLRYASSKLQNDDDIALFAIKNNLNALDVINPNFLADKKFLIKVMKNADKDYKRYTYEALLEYIEEPLSNDRYFLSELERLSR